MVIAVTERADVVVLYSVTCLFYDGTLRKVTTSTNPLLYLYDKTTTLFTEVAIVYVEITTGSTELSTACERSILYP